MPKDPTPDPDEPRRRGDAADPAPAGAGDRRPPAPGDVPLSTWPPPGARAAERGSGREATRTIDAEGDDAAVAGEDEGEPLDADPLAVEAVHAVDDAGAGDDDPEGDPLDADADAAIEEEAEVEDEVAGRVLGLAELTGHDDEAAPAAEVAAAGAASEWASPAQAGAGPGPVGGPVGAGADGDPPGPIGAEDELGPAPAVGDDGAGVPVHGSALPLAAGEVEADPVAVAAASADDPSVDAGADVEQAPVPAPDRRAIARTRRRRRRVLALLVVGAMLAVVLQQRQRADDLAAQRDDRRLVERVAEAFGSAYLSYDFNDPEGSARAVQQLSTAAFAEAYAAQSAPAIQELFSSRQTTTSARTREVFVGAVRRVSARALVVVDVTATSPGEGEQELDGVSFVLDLARAGGGWRVTKVARAPQPRLQGTSTTVAAAPPAAP